MDIYVSELKEKIDRKDDFFFLDVREPYEYEADNLGAVLIPMGDIPQKLEELKVYMDKEIVVHCRSGARSGQVKQFLMDQGFRNVRNLIGGILEWRAFVK